MDLNEKIFETVKQSLTKEVDNNLLMKICSGQASEQEKDEWKKNMNLSDEIDEKLQESYNLGYVLASEFDNEPTKEDLILKELKKMNEKIDLLFQKIEDGK